MDTKHGPFLTVEQAAERLGVNPSTIRYWVKTRGLPVVRLGRRCVRYQVEDLDSWATGHRVVVECEIQ